MKFSSITSDDLPLYEKLFMNEEYMKYLGGVQTQERTHKMFQSHLNHSNSGKGKILKVIPEDEDFEEKFSIVQSMKEDEDYFDYHRGVGTVCVWHGFFQDKVVTELGWGILPRYQGLGLATKALKMFVHLIEETEPQWGDLHAFTGSDNIASNRLCQKVGFQSLGEVTIDFDGHDLPSNHYIYPINQPL
jgi:RimJ/RimL family protein N-acetyltransferase